MDCRIIGGRFPAGPCGLPGVCNGISTPSFIYFGCLPVANISFRLSAIYHIQRLVHVSAVLPSARLVLFFCCFSVSSLLLLFFFLEWSIPWGWTSGSAAISSCENMELKWLLMVIWWHLQSDFYQVNQEGFPGLVGCNHFGGLTHSPWAVFGVLSFFYLYHVLLVLVHLQLFVQGCELPIFLFPWHLLVFGAIQYFPYLFPFSWELDTVWVVDFLVMFVTEGIYSSYILVCFHDLVQLFLSWYFISYLIFTVHQMHLGRKGILCLDDGILQSIVGSSLPHL